jgi:hypothetical protein
MHMHQPLGNNTSPVTIQPTGAPILQVEAVTGVPREQLRPDLYERLPTALATA